MKTDQARDILAAVQAHESAVLNLRNAAAMSTDDPRAAKMLEDAGDAYARTATRLEVANRGAIADIARGGMAAVEDIAVPEADPVAAQTPSPSAEGDKSAKGGATPPKGGSGPEKGGKSPGASS